MMARVKMPTGEVVDIPDDISDADLAKLEPFMRSGTPISAPPGAQASASLPQQFGRQLGLTVRAGVTGVTGLAGMLGDAANAGINMLTGAQLQKPSELIQRGMTAVGIPEPEGLAENVAGFGASVLAGGRDPAALAALRAMPGLPAGVTAAKAAAKLPGAVERSQAAGFVYPPSMAKTKLPGRLLEAAVGKPRLEAAARAKDSALVDNLSRKAAGLPDDAPLTRDTLENAIKQTYQEGYAPIERIGKIPVLSKLRDTFGVIAKEDATKGHTVLAGIKRKVHHLSPVEAIKQLRTDADDAFRTGRTTEGRMYRKAATAVEDNIDEYLTKSGSLSRLQGQGLVSDKPQELLENFRNARVAMAKQYAVRDALQGESVDAAKLGAKLKRGKPLTGELRTIAEFANSAPKLAHPSPGDPPITNMQEVMGTGLLSLAHPSALALPVARGVGRAALLSKPGQALFAHPAGPSGPPVRALTRLPTLLQGLFGNNTLD